MSRMVAALAAAVIWLGTGFGAEVGAADPLEAARPLDSAALNDIRTGISASIFLALTRGLASAESALPPYRYCAVRDYACALLAALGTVEQGASAAVASVGHAIGGAIDPMSFTNQTVEEPEAL